MTFCSFVLLFIVNIMYLLPLTSVFFFFSTLHVFIGYISPFFLYLHVFIGFLFHCLLDSSQRPEYGVIKSGGGFKLVSNYEKRRWYIGLSRIGRAEIYMHTYKLDGWWRSGPGWVSSLGSQSTPSYQRLTSGCSSRP
ncbi:hypothetical protein V8F20_001290 [Naviculisporaceae sp. PSN 640]